MIYHERALHNYNILCYANTISGDIRAVHDGNVEYPMPSRIVIDCVFFGVV